MNAVHTALRHSEDSRGRQTESKRPCQEGEQCFSLVQYTFAELCALCFPVQTLLIVSAFCFPPPTTSHSPPEPCRSVTSKQKDSLGRHTHILYIHARACLWPECCLRVCVCAYVRMCVSAYAFSRFGSEQKEQNDSTCQRNRTCRHSRTSFELE